VPSRAEVVARGALLAWTLERPVVATGAGDVMRGVVDRAGGGVACHGYDELAAALDLLEADAPLADALGRQGRSYVAAEHALPVVLDRLEGLVGGLGARGAAAA
jgi:hypothetical protein